MIQSIPGPQTSLGLILKTIQNFMCRALALDLAGEDGGARGARRRREVEILLDSISCHENHMKGSPLHGESIPGVVIPSRCRRRHLKTMGRFTFFRRYTASTATTLGPGVFPLPRLSSTVNMPLCLPLELPAATLLPRLRRSSNWSRREQ